MRDSMERDRTITRIGPARRGSPFARLWRWFKQARENPQARRSRRVTLILVLLWIVSGFDLVFTLLAVKTGEFVEGNPLAAPLMDDPALLVIFKVLVVAMASIIIFKFRKRLFTEIGCWGLCLTYTLLSAIWWIYYFQHH
ncbi:MAG: hypothetical protein KAV00_05500 [Phycisphaerae bacterium]|nr:hypothetical protein [Phycisphaerae bacterium]